MRNEEVESLAQDLARDVQESGVTEIVITSEGKLQSMSLSDFDILKVRLSELVPGLTVLYKLKT